MRYSTIYHPFLKNHRKSLQEGIIYIGDQCINTFSTQKLEEPIKILSLQKENSLAIDMKNSPGRSTYIIVQ